jgi:AraC-like DNA-binding protein
MHVQFPPMNRRVTATLDGMEVVEVQVPAGVCLSARQQQLGNITLFWEGEVLVEGRDGPPIRVGTGEMLYHPPFFACAETFVTGSVMVIIELEEQKRLELFSVLADPLSPIRFPTKHLEHITADIRRELHDSRSGRSLVLSSLVTQLVVLGARSAENTAGREIPDLIQRVQRIIRAAFAAPPALAEIARLLGVSREHLARTFRCHVGMSISEFVRSVRIAHLKELLTDPTLCLGSVALRSGFYDQSHMNRTFKISTGMTPSQYRRSLRYDGDTGRGVDHVCGRVFALRKASRRPLIDPHRSEEE